MLTRLTTVPHTEIFSSQGEIPVYAGNCLGFLSVKGKNQPVIAFRVKLPALRFALFAVPAEPFLLGV